MMQKWILPSSFVAALAVSFLLFVFMAYLISKPDQTIVTSGPTFHPEIYNTEPKDLKTNVDKTRKLKEMPETPPPPAQRKLDLPSEDDPIVTGLPDLNVPKLDLGTGIGIGTNSSSSPIDNTLTNSRDGDAMPISQVEPVYPMDAARRGIEGWVRLSFDIDPTGSVVNISVLDANPRNVFEKAARRALRKWRYKAKFEGGMPVMQNNLSVQLEFTLDKR